MCCSCDEKLLLLILIIIIVFLKSFIKIKHKIKFCVELNYSNTRRVLSIERTGVSSLYLFFCKIINEEILYALIITYAINAFKMSLTGVA